MLARKALAGTAGAPKLYVEDVMSSYLYTGNGSTQTITNNIDLSTNGGLVWTKCRNTTWNNAFVDTERGGGSWLNSNDTAAAGTGTYLTFNTDGYLVNNSFNNWNGNTNTYASWTFRKAKKFFDVVTYTGNGTSGRTVSHNLGSTPGCIIVKNTSDAGENWIVYHRSLGATKNLKLNLTNAEATGTGFWNDTAPTSTVFSVGNDGSTNNNGSTYVAYIFAHDAGGFGDAGSDNVISCGSFTTNASGNATVTLGYEPQFLIMKKSSNTGSWYVIDTMRDWGVNSGSYVFANTTAAESAGLGSFFPPSATGFASVNGGLDGSSTYIYIAIRRGPMKTPTTGTSVFGVTTAGENTNISLSGRDFDAYIGKFRSGTDAGTGLASTEIIDRLRGLGVYTSWVTGNTSPSSALRMASTAAEVSTSNMGIVPSSVSGNGNLFLVSRNSLDSNVLYGYRRAPGFFDVVCYTGTGSATTFSHNLGVAPELMIVKCRSTASTGWIVYDATNTATNFSRLDTTQATSAASTMWNNTSPTASVFSVGTHATVNNSSDTYVAYLFASVSGVSKVGSYTGNGSSVTVTTDFQPRFILVKRTDSTGNWIVSDSARGLVAGNDPYLLLNSTAAEDTDEDWVDVSSTGFTVNETTANANVNTGTYIYLAIS